MRFGRRKCITSPNTTSLGIPIWGVHQFRDVTIGIMTGQTLISKEINEANSRGSEPTHGKNVSKHLWK